LPAEILDLCGGLVDLLLAAGRGDNLGAGFGKAQRECAANTGCTAGHHCDSSFQTQKL
jgi:hypothetical protein